MHKKLNIGILILTLFIFGACSKNEFLDVTPKGIILPSKVEDFRLLLDNSDLYTQKHLSTPYSSDQLLVTTESNAFILPEQKELNLFLFKDVIYGASQDDLDWNTYYQQVFEANIVLEGLSKVTDGTPEEVALLESEAKLHRAYAYFNLVNIYGVHYNPATASADLGVPIREGIGLFNVDLTRASVKAIYDFVISEIKSSIDNLSDTQPLNFSFRPSKAAAYALLAKVYLYQAEYQKALDNIEEALALYNVLRDINEEEVLIPTDPATPRATVERFWPDITQDSQIVWHKSVIIDLILNEGYGNLFENDDLRSQWITYMPTAFEDDPELKLVNGYLFVAGGGSTNAGTDGVYTPDMYLIRAECNARLGNLQAANDDLNALREKRYAAGTFTALDITDQDELLQFVKDERRREFPTSVERSFDIKRYNRFDNANITINHEFNGETVTVLPNSKNWAQPIGLRYINFNPEIAPNPRD